MNKPTTIYDIAKKLNVSAATVSRVLSKSSYPVRPELARRIKETAEQMNYMPNSIGRQLKTNKTSTIGVVIPSITNPFYAAVVSGVEEIASEKGYHVLLCNSQQNAALEISHLTTLFEKQVKGVILSPVSGASRELKAYMNNGLKVVSIDQTIDDFSGFQINFDYRKGGMLGTRHLLENGHRDIAFLTAPLTLPSRKQLLQGFKETMAEAGISVPDDRIVVGGDKGDGEEASRALGEFENGRRLTKRLLQTKPWPTAIFACNDMTAFGVLNELMSQQVRVPEQISVIGFDNLEFGGIVSPSLSTIEQPKYEMGRMACRMLMEWMDKTDNQPGEMILQPRLVERASVRAR
ncbi:LacI family DNA-binding transcriptional regulator [Cohnella sp. GCM10027633]|uniref:LacI family DNA-binding transcriptional regulator n=1 Tax=unclassified Cohnella TaxID=2636738 RepID=UPI003625DCC8